MADGAGRKLKKTKRARERGTLAQLETALAQVQTGAIGAAVIELGHDPAKLVLTIAIAALGSGAIGGFRTFALPRLAAML